VGSIPASRTNPLQIAPGIRRFTLRTRCAMPLWRKAHSRCRRRARSIPRFMFSALVQARLCGIAAIGPSFAF
jgi:hypothetical protein